MIRVSLCQRNKSRGILTWYARIFDTETKEIRYESLGTTKKTEAKDLMQAKHAAGEFNRKEKDSLTVGKVFDMYLTDMESRGSNRDSVRTVRHSLDSVKEIFNRPIAEVTKKDVMQAFSASVANFKPATYNCTKTSVKTAFKFAKDVLEVIESNPADGLKSRRNTAKEKEFWTLAQIDQILDATHKPLFRLLFAFMAFAGLRIHEAMKMKPEDLKDGFLSVIGKGQKFAKVPISSRLSAELDRLNWQFDFSGMSKDTISRTLIAAVKKLKDEGYVFNGNVNPHRFRHSFASNLIRSGVGAKSVQKLMRHANIQTTLNIYAHLFEDDLVEDIEKMFTIPLTKT